MSGGRISISYAGVHTAYQLALAAQELGELNTFYCALYDDPLKWGARFSRFAGTGMMEGRRAEGLDLDKVTDFPWPILAKLVRDRVYPRGSYGWLAANATFDGWVANRICRSPPGLFVGVATSDLHSLRAARAVGAALAHDVPSLHPLFEEALMNEAAERARMPMPLRKRRWKRYDMKQRKLNEFALADCLFLYSEFHRRGFVRYGFAPDRISVTPLWADPAIWYRAGDWREPVSGSPLNLLFVGTVTLRKGIPFLLRAVEMCGGAVKLTIVGPHGSDAAKWLGGVRQNVQVLPAQPKPQLRRTFEAHDVFVLPSVGDSFGYVALEAMACGLPVIVTNNCGAPVPDPSWSVPAMDPDVLAARMMHYADAPERVAADGRIAIGFARQFTPEHYRRKIGEQMKALLEARS